MSDNQAFKFSDSSPENLAIQIKWMCIISDKVTFIYICKQI